MRRYFPLLLISVFIVLLSFIGTTLLAGYAGRQRPENIKTIIVYTTLPVEQVSLLANEFEHLSNIRVTLVPLSPKELLTKITAEKSSPKSDLILADEDVLRQAKKLGLLTPFSSEMTDIVSDHFKDAEGSWTGLWYDVFVFAANKDSAKVGAVDSLVWGDLAKGNLRLSMTDFLAADAAARLLFTLTNDMGVDKAMEYLGKLHPQIVQYAKFLSTPVRMAAMGETDIAIAVQSEALRYVKDGFPVRILYPANGTAYVLTGAGLTKLSPAPEAKQFMDWLLGENPQKTLIENRFYFVPTNPEIAVSKPLFPAQIKLLDAKEPPTAEMRRQILDRWVQTVRLAPKP